MSLGRPLRRPSSIHGIDNLEQTENMLSMLADTEDPPSDSDRLKQATDEVIASCGGDMRAAIQGLIVANEFLESEICELMQAVSHAYARRRPSTG
jgi:hypothetical protein